MFAGLHNQSPLLTMPMGLNFLDLILVRREDHPVNLEEELFFFN